MSQRRQDRSFLFAMLLLALALRWMGFTDPWSWGSNGDDPGFRNLMGACSVGLLVRNFHRDGLAPSAGMPHYVRLGLPNGERVDSWYSHHPAGWPVLCTLVVNVLGMSEWALRLPALVCALLSIVLIWRFVTDLLGREHARWATLAMAVYPLGTHFGIQPWGESAVVAAVIAVAHRYLRFLRTQERRHLLWAGLWTLVGGLVDWPAFFVLVGIGIHALLQWRRTSWRSLFPVLVLGGAAAIAILVHVVHVAMVLPAESVATDIDDTSDYLFRVPGGVLAFVGTHGSHLWRLLTPVGCLLVVVGAVVQLSQAVREPEGERRVLLGTLFLCGLLNIVAFPGRSFNHAFFHLLAMPWYACSAAIGASAIVGVSRGVAARRVTALCLAGLLTVTCAVRTYDLWQTYRGPELEETLDDPWLAPILADRDAIVLTDSWRVMMFGFYASSRFMLLKSPHELLDLKEKGLHLAPGYRVYFISDPVGRGEWRRVWPHIAPLPRTTHGTFTVTPLSGG